MKVKRYEWAEHFRINADPNPVGKAVERLGRKLGRDVQGIAPAELVQEATDEASPLHPLFTWDDTEAARLHREEEARYVLRSIRIVSEDRAGKETTHIGLVAVKIEGESGRLYVPKSLAERHASLRDQMRADALAGLLGWKRRYEELEGGGPAVELVDKAIAALRKNAERTAPQRRAQAV